MIIPFFVLVNLDIDMSISPNDISFVYSGGVNNNNSELSLGGFPSVFPIPGSIDNLFPDISGREVVAGKTDYRCFYIFNDNITDSFFNTSIWTQSQTASKIEIGLLVL